MPPAVDPELFKSAFAPPDPSQQVGKGDLVMFNYTSFVNDPYPLVVVSGLDPKRSLLKGVNLHYLTFNYIKKILSVATPVFSYQGNVKGDAYITNAFRSYKIPAVRQVKKLDKNFLIEIMSVVRSFDPSEIKAIKDSINKQLRQKVNPTAEDLSALTAQPQTPVTPLPQQDLTPNIQTPPTQGQEFGQEGEII